MVATTVLLMSVLAAGVLLVAFAVISRSRASPARPAHDSGAGDASWMSAGYSHGSSGNDGGSDCDPNDPGDAGCDSSGDSFGGGGGGGDGGGGSD